MKKPKDMRQIIPSPPALQTEPYMTYPLSDIESQREGSAVSVPPLSDVIEAKEWVDHNQK
ncbi:MAG: DUF3787 domain-containing protein [Peptococcaceae bacterium]|jgi:hypothetical protein|nr:DUF3787 domain-containing protein [Peptococcaceae bacterium]MDR2737265.1 DUF3787 domain-containing protein [Gracilibacteraceae bacterium]